MNLNEFKREFSRALEISALDKNMVLLKEENSLDAVSKELVSFDAYIRVIENDVGKYDKIYFLSIKYNELFALEKTTILNHLYFALAFIKTTYIHNMGAEHNIVFLTLLKEANIPNVIERKYDRVLSELMDTYNEIYNVNKYVNICRQLLLLKDENSIFDLIYDITFMDISFNEFLFILINEFSMMDVSFDSLIKVFKVLFIYFDYRLFYKDEAYKLMIKNINHDYYAKYRVDKINGYDFIVLVDKYLESKLAFIDFKSDLVDYFIVLVEKDNKSLTKKMIVKSDTHYSSGSLDFEVN